MSIREKIKKKLSEEDKILVEGPGGTYSIYMGNGKLVLEIPGRIDTQSASPKFTSEVIVLADPEPLIDMITTGRGEMKTRYQTYVNRQRI
jgi:hypothetical protein